jgi:predicted nuclease of predicted toxin-antitoxin system
MRFLVDECTGPSVATWLQSQGYEVFSIYDLARGMDDESVIEKAISENWILITNDKDFGEKVIREHKPHHGVIFLRLDDERSKSKIGVLKQLLENHTERLPEKFVVVTEKKVRFVGQ